MWTAVHACTLDCSIDTTRERNAHLAAEGANLKQSLQDAAAASTSVDLARTDVDASTGHEPHVRFTPDIDVGIDDDEDDGDDDGEANLQHGFVSFSPTVLRKEQQPTSPSPSRARVAPRVAARPARASTEKVSRMAAVGTRVLPEIHAEMTTLQVSPSKTGAEGSQPPLSSREERMLDKSAPTPGSLSPSQRRRILQHVEAVTVSPISRRRDGKPIIPDSLA